MNNWYELTCPSCKTRHLSPSKEEMEEVTCCVCFFPMAGVADIDWEVYDNNAKIMAKWADAWKDNIKAYGAPTEDVKDKMLEFIDTVLMAK